MWIGMWSFYEAHISMRRVEEQPVRLWYYAKFSDNAGVRTYGSTLRLIRDLLGQGLPCPMRVNLTKFRFMLTPFPLNREPMVRHFPDHGARGTCS